MSKPETPTDDGDSGGMGFEDVDAAVSVVTSGDPIRSWMEYPTVLAEESKINFGPNGVSLSVVDPTNVGMLTTTLPASGFSDYRYHADDDQLTIGVPLTRLQNALSFARKRQDDPVRIDVITGGYRPRVRVSTLRPDQHMKQFSEFFTIDPDSLRMEPDVPDLSLDYRASPGVRALKEAVENVGQTHEHAWFAIDGSDLILGSQPNSSPNLDGDNDVVDTVVFPNAAWVADDAPDGTEADFKGSIFSIDYLKDMTRAMKSGKADRVTIRFDVEFPMKMDWSNDDWGHAGTYMLAPRIQTGDKV